MAAPAAPPLLTLVASYLAVIPITHGRDVIGVLVIVGKQRDPFTALGDTFLLAIGQQIGAALENAELYRRLEQRTDELQSLSRRMLRQHEAERHRLSLELHDETAQLFSAMKMQLGLLREDASSRTAARLDRVLSLVDAGMGSIRDIASQLRPPLLDDLGLPAAMEAVVADFAEHGSITVRLDGASELPALESSAELVLFRVLQEGLANVARHAMATHVDVSLRVEHDGVSLRVSDDGRGFGATTPEDAALESSGAARQVVARERMGLTGMRERLADVGGSLELLERAGGGAIVLARVPLTRRVRSDAAD